MKRALCTLACGVVVLGAATGAVAWGGSSEPHAHSAAVPDLTGEWVNQANPSGSPPWQLKTSSSLANLEAHWTGGPGHAQLRGEFHGTLSPGGSYYEGPDEVTEGETRSSGTATFVIVNANQIKIEIAGAKYIFVRVGGASNAITPNSTPPALGKTTLYEAPAPGATGSTPLPKLASKSRDLEGQIGFVDNEGQPVQGPDDAAVEAQAERAGKLCYLFITTAGNSLKEQDEVTKVFGVATPSFATCVNAVSRVLARNDELVRKRAEGARAKAAKRACAAFVRGKRAAHSMLRVRCKATATGLSFDIRPRSSKHSLAAVLRGHAPKLIVARSAVAPGPAGLRLSELWHAK